MVLIALCTFAGTHGDTVARFYAPALPAEAGGVARVLDGLGAPALRIGETQPSFGGGLRAVEGAVTVDDPLGLLAAARDRWPVEADVFCDLSIPTGRPDLPEYVWRLLVSSTSRGRTLSPDLYSVAERTVELRCGLGALQGPEAPPSPGQTLARYLGRCLALGETAAPARRVLARLPVYPTAAGTSPAAVRFSTGADADGVPTGALTGDRASAYDALDTLAAAMTLTVYQCPDPATWRDGVTGGLAAPGPTSAPVWAVVPRWREGDPIDDAHVLSAEGAVAAAASVPADRLTLRPEDWLAGDDGDDLDPLRALTFDPTPGAEAFGEVVAATYAGTPPSEFTSELAFVGSVAPDADLAFRLRLTADYGGVPGRGGGRLALALYGDDGTTYYGTPDGWTTTAAPALEGGTDVTADVPASLPIGGGVYLVVYGARDADAPNALVTYAEASAALVDPATGDPAEVRYQAVRFDVGFGGYTSSVPLLPRMEAQVGGGPFQDVPFWSSETASFGSPRLSDAQAAERAAQEGRRLPTYRPTVAVVTGPTTRFTFRGGPADVPSAFAGSGVEAVTTGASVDPVTGETVVHATETGPASAVAVLSPGPVSLPTPS